MKLPRSAALSVLALFLVAGDAGAGVVDESAPPDRGRQEFVRRESNTSGAYGNTRSQAHSGSSRYREGELLVKFRPSATEEKKKNLHKKHGSEKLKEFKALRLHHVKLKKGLNVEDAVRQYRSDPDVEYAEPDYLWKAMDVPNDQYYGNLWGMAKINAPTAWHSVTGSGSVVVAVIDTGIDHAHPDLATNTWVNSREAEGNDVDDDNNGFIDDIHGIDAITGSGNPMDENGHGTHVAGTIGAVGNNTIGVAGVNWNVGIMGCKFLNAWGVGATDGAITCLDYIKKIKDTGVNIVATNNSWGGGAYSQALFDAIDDQRDILFIAAAGNGYSDNDKTASYPANYALPNIIAVAATDSSDAKADFSNKGRRTVHVGAPGVDIVSLRAGVTDIYGDGQHFIPAGDAAALYYRASGTSMAAPHVSGLAALLKSQNTGRDWITIKNLILAGGDGVSAMNGSTVTGKRINAYGSLTCSNGPVFSVLNYPSSFTVGTPATVSALSINCGLSSGPVTVTPAGGAPITLADDGVAPDQVAGDGIFTGTWTPSRTGEHLRFASPLGSETIVTPPLDISAYLPEGNLQAPAYDHTLTATGGVPPYHWHLMSSMPPGLNFDEASGRIWRSVTTQGEFPLEFSVIDSLFGDAPKKLLLRIVDQPVIEKWVRTFNRNGDDFVCDMAVDGDGNVYVTGESQPGSYDSPPSDFLTVKYDQAGNELWHRTFDRGGRDTPWSIVVDRQGNVYVGGTSYSAEHGDEGVIVKYDSSGNLLWTRVAPFGCMAYGLAVDTNNDLYVTGWLSTVKYDSSGNILWEKAYPDPLQYGRSSVAIAADSDNNVYVTGIAWNGGDLYVGYTDYTLTVKYNSAGDEIWSQSHDVSFNWEYPRHIAVDEKNGYVYVVASNIDFENAGGIMKYDLDGNLQWHRDNPSAYGVTVDDAGSVYLAYYRNSIDYDFQAVTSKYDQDFNPVWTKTYQTPKSDVAYRVALDRQGNFYAAGWSQDEDFDFLTVKYTDPAFNSLPFGVVDVPYTQTILTTAKVTPYTWSIVSGSLPGGLALNGSTGVISGIPTASGAFTFTLRYQHGAFSATKTFKVSVFERVVITTTSLPPGVVGADYSQTLQVTGGTLPYSWSVVTGALPSGLVLSGSSGTISGLIAGGSQTFTVQVKDANNVTDTKVLTITTNLVIATVSLPPAIVGAPYAQALNGIGGAPPYTWSVDSGALPTGLTLNETGTVSGTPTAMGTFSFTVRVTDSASATAARSYVVTVTVPQPLFSWGSNGYGQLGDGTTTNRYVPVQVPGLTGVTAVSTKDFHSMALKTDGTVWTWGSNGWGGLGDGTMTNRYAPAQVPGLTGVTAIAAGTTFSMALKSDGTVWTWGDNFYGQLGNGTVTARLTPVQVAGLTDITAIAAGSSFAMALKSDRTVWTWGYNGYGQLGDGTRTARVAPVQVSGLTGVSAVSAGSYFAMALRSDGTVRAWGSNGDGQLGDGTNTERITPVQVSGLSGVTAIRAGTFHAIALKSDGTVRTWGANYGGVLGDGTYNGRRIPGTVSGLTGVTAVAVGGGHSMALKSDGTVRIWGSNTNGQLGDGTTTNRLTPVQVPGLSGVSAIAAGADLSMALVVPIQIWNDALSSGVTGTSYSQTLSAGLGTPPYTWSILSGDLPVGLTLGSSTGVIGGVPTAPGSFAFTVSVADATGRNTTKRLLITVASPSCSSLPLRIVGAGTTLFSDLASAGSQAADNDTIQLQAVTFSGDIDFSNDVRISLEGGYDCGFTDNSGSSILVSGKLSVAGGMVNIGNVRFR